LNIRYSSHLISTLRLNSLEYLSADADLSTLKVNGINHIEEIYHVAELILNFFNIVKYIVIIEIARKMHIMINLFIQNGRKTRLLTESIFQDRFIPPITDHGSKNAIPKNIKTSLSSILYAGSASKTLFPTK